MSTERVIVQREISQSLITAVTDITTKLTTGDPNTSSTPEKINIGPVFNESHAKGILNLLKDAKEHGAEVLLGDLAADGAIVKPHLLLGVKPGMAAWDRESFGPGKYEMTLCGKGDD